MKKQMALALSLVTLAGTAIAAPRESGNAPASVPVYSDDSGLATAFTLPFTGIFAGVPYTALSVNFAGELASNAAGTWPSDTLIDITPPGGAPATYRVSIVNGGYTTFTLNYTAYLAAAAAPAGNWSFLPHDDFEDGTGTDPEAFMNNLVVTLDDTGLTAPPSEDLGTLVDGTTVSRTVVVDAASVKWYRFSNLDCSDASGRQLTISTLESTMGGDSEIAVYATSGVGIATNDDAGDGLFSQLVLGARGFVDLPAGTHYLPVSSYNAAFGIDNFNVTSTGPGGEFALTVLQTLTLPLEINGTGSSQTGSTVAATVEILPGGGPASTGLTVTGVLGGTLSGTATFLDNGVGADALAGDNIFTASVTVPGSPADGDAYTIDVTATDAQSRSATVTITGAVDTIGQSIATANIPSGTGSLSSIAGFLGTSDVDLFKVNICDFASFSATTVGTGVAFNDTQIFLFNTDGMGVTFNDDSVGFYSTITALNLTANGDYYLAISHYDIDPVDSNDQELWIDEPFGTERAPDGPGMSNPLANWTGTNAVTDSGTYTIALTGACFPSAGPLCGPADIGSTGGTPGADGRLDNNDFIVFIDRFFANAPSADIGTTGGSAGSDGLWNNNDFIVFIDQFFNGPASCR